MNKSSKTLALILAFVIALTLAPVTAFADSIQAGPPSAPATIGFGGKQWAVIGNSGSKLTLLLANGFSYGNSKFNNNTSDGNAYSNSVLQLAMNNAYNSLNNQQEKSLVLPRDLSDVVPVVSGAMFWPLSKAEANVVSAEVLMFSTDWWWLRSPGYLKFYAVTVTSDGRVHDDIDLVNYDLAVRPAFDMNLSSVVFTSAAAGGKSTLSNPNLSQATPPTGAVKFTVKDSSISAVPVKDTSARTAKPGDALTIETGSLVVMGGGSGEHYISCAIVNDAGTVLYYGRPTTTGGLRGSTVSFNVPSTLPNGAYTIELYSEVGNGDNFTDFCSAPASIPLTVSATGSAFTPVQSITGLPTAATADTPLTLTGTVTPSEATNKTITWDIVSAGTTGATISGSTFTATAAGTATVRATVANGATSATPYTQTFTITVTSNKPAISGGQPAMSLKKGYAATSTAAFTVTGTPEPTVTKTSGDGKITWNNSMKRLDIAAGLEKGTYPVVLTATNSAGNATFTFTLTVTDKDTPTITGPTTMSLKEGYAATSTGAYAITGDNATVEKTSGNASITWNSGAKTLNIAAGLKKDTYPVVLTVKNADGESTLTFILTVTEETGTGKMSNFRRSKTYARGMFPDISETEWFGLDKQKTVANAYEYGLMIGSNGNFNPAGNMNIAEAITVAARVHSIYTTGTDNFVQGNPWYMVYVTYALTNNIIAANDFTDYTKKITRAEMAYIFSRALPASELPTLNTVNSVQDVTNGTPYRDAILMLYKAGVVEGSGEKHLFNPNNNIIRAEAAAIIARVILPETRLSGKTY